MMIIFAWVAFAILMRSWGGVMPQASKSNRYCYWQIREKLNINSNLDGIWAPVSINRKMIAKISSLFGAF
jgi:hypothetical protein